uniref:Uncharacterized protein n=1 Tax=Cacopsylla melanoneura TaxID=428564 RepID=A0A8D8W7P5_9HEMI
MAMRTLLVAIRNSSAELLLNHALRFASQEILLRPGPLLLLIFPCRILCNNSYLCSFLMMCPKYCSLRVFIMLTNSASLFIRRNTSALVIFCIQDILNILLYSQSSNALNLFVVASVSVHVSTPYNRTENT